MKLRMYENHTLELRGEELYERRSSAVYFNASRSNAATAIYFRENTVPYYHTLTQFPKFLCIACLFDCFLLFFFYNASTRRQLCY